VVQEEFLGVVVVLAVQDITKVQEELVGLVVEVK